MENVLAQQNVIFIVATVVALFIAVSIYAYFLTKKAKSIIANATQRSEQIDEEIKELDKKKEVIQNEIEELIEEEDGIKSRITYSNNFLAVANKDREEASKKYESESKEYKNNLDILKG